MASIEDERDLARRQCHVLTLENQLFQKRSSHTSITTKDAPTSAMVVKCFRDQKIRGLIRVLEKVD